jgi:membrane protease YdiL (CAAX protease family)
MKNHLNRQLWQFFLFTFSFSWLLWLPGLLITHKLVNPTETLISTSNFLKWIAGTGPSLAAIFLTGINGGKTEVKKLFSRLWNIKLGYWYFPVLLLLPATLIIAHLLNIILFHASFPSSGLLTEFWWIPIIFLIFLIMQFSEELGWRGYALDRLQKRWNAVFSSVLLGIIWAIWHLPMFLISGFGQYDNQLPYGQFFITLVLISVLITWLQNNTNGSLVPAFIIHAMLNLSGEVLPLVEKSNNTQCDYMPWIISNILLCLIIIVVIFIWGYKKLVRT